MRIIVSLARRMQSGRHIMFHGTSSTFLPSILKKGLMETGKRVWQEDPDASFHKPSRISHGGIYFTSSLMYAISSAFNAKKKFKGNTLIICALIQTRSGLPDEDDYANTANPLLEYGGSDRGHATFYGFLLKKKDNKLHGQEAEYLENRLNKYKEYVIERYGKPKVPNFDTITENLFFSGVKRKTAYITDYDYKSALSDIGFNYDNPPPKPDKNEAEQDFIKALDKFIIATRHTAHIKPGDSPFNATIRLPKIEFKGRNRITAIVEIIEKESTVLKTHYGKIPDQFIRQYKERVGGKYILTNK